MGRDASAMITIGQLARSFADVLPMKVAAKDLTMLSDRTRISIAESETTEETSQIDLLG
jgi:hypothetical protein